MLQLYIYIQFLDMFYFSFIIQVGHAVCTDDAVKILKNYFVDMKNFQDTLLMASQLGLKWQSLRKLVAMFLGQRLCKKHQRSDWEKRVLMDKQISYACTDAWASLRLYQSIIRYGNTHCRGGKGFSFMVEGWSSFVHVIYVTLIGARASI